MVDRIEAALWHSNEAIARHAAKNDINKKLSDLTEHEQSVMRLVVEGLPNKLIAKELTISVRTVEVHRARMFDKLGVKFAVELMNLMQIKV